MPGFFTRSSFGQPQPQVAQLPFSQFGGERPILPTDTTGGLPFPDAGQPQPTASPLSPFMSPTGLSSDELDALLGRIPTTKQDIISIDQPFTQFGRFTPQVQQNIAQQQARKQSFLEQNPIQSTTSTLPIGGIPFEGSGGFDKFNPVLAGGIPLNNVNLVQPPNLSLDQTKLGGGF